MHEAGLLLAKFHSTIKFGTSLKRLKCLGLSNRVEFLISFDNLLWRGGNTYLFKIILEFEVIPTAIRIDHMGPFATQAQ